MNCACCFRFSSVSAASAFAFQRFIVSALCQHVLGGANLFGVVFSEPFLAILKSFGIRDWSRSVFTVFVFLCISRSIFALSPVFPFPVSLGEECGLHRKGLMSLLAFHKMHQLEGDTNWKDTNNFDTPGHIHRMPNLSGTPRKMRVASETGFPSCGASTDTR